MSACAVPAWEVVHLLLPLFYKPVLHYLRWHYRAFLAGVSEARSTQEQVLLEKVRRNADSDFGKAHGFSSIKTIADFRERVPVTDYAYYRDYIERVKQGETTAMFGPGTRIRMFAMTSGTTDRSKYIPVTQAFVDEYRRGWLTWGAQLFGDHQDQMPNLALQLSSDWQQSYTDAGIPCGNISGLTAAMAPSYTRLSLALPLGVIKVKDPAAKHYTALRIAMARRRVGVVITANPSTLLEFARRADEEADSLIRDIHDGTLSQQVDVPPAVRAQLRGVVSRKDPTRARELESIRKRTGHLYPKDFWPQLTCFALWTGGSVGMYLPLLKDYYAVRDFRDIGLIASEGRMTLPIEDGTNVGILDYMSHFFEFIPEDEIDREDPTVLQAHELETGKDYYILLTTSSGLYRYDIHDVVRCHGYVGQAPRLEFLNKGAHFCSLTGEKLSEFQVVGAVRDALQAMALPIETFTLAPVMDGQRAGYELLLEPNPARPPDDEVAALVDRNLGLANMEYADKRDSQRLMPLRVRQVPAGTWTEFRRRRTSERGNLEEFKHPCLVNDLQFIGKLVGQTAEVTA